MRMQRSPLIALILPISALFSVAVPLFALPSASQVGGNSAEFLEQGFGARALGMGEAYGPVAQGADAIYWNPAGLAALHHPEFTYTHSEPLIFFHQDFAAYAQPLSNEGTAGVSYTRFYQDSLPLVTNTNQTIGSFSPFSESLSLAFAKSFKIGANAEQVKAGKNSGQADYAPKGFLYMPGSELTAPPPGQEPARGILSVGLAAKIIHEQFYDQNASAFALDGGLLLRASQESPLAVSVSFRNIGTQERFINENESLPTDFNAGAAYRFDLSKGTLLAAVEVAMPFYSNPYIKAGAEYSAAVTNRVSMALRLGYESLTASDLGFLSGLTGGVGVRYDQLSLDFGIEPMLALGENYRISLTIGW